MFDSCWWCCYYSLLCPCLVSNYASPLSPKYALSCWNDKLIWVDVFFSLQFNNAADPEILCDWFPPHYLSRLFLSRYLVFARRHGRPWRSFVKWLPQNEKKFIFVNKGPFVPVKGLTKGPQSGVCRLASCNLFCLLYVPASMPFWDEGGIQYNFTKKTIVASPWLQFWHKLYLTNRPPSHISEWRNKQKYCKSVSLTLVW